MAYLYGRDFYHGNSDFSFNDALVDNDIKFIIHKASEGATWHDPKFKERAKAVFNTDKYLGAYHYCRPENRNTATLEATNFISMILDFKSVVRPFLDIEGGALNPKYVTWFEEFLETMKRFGYTNVGIYCSLSAAKGVLKQIAEDYPVWIAHYNKADEKEGCKHYDNEIITQYDSTTVDKDVWNTDALPERAWSIEGYEKWILEGSSANAGSDGNGGALGFVPTQGEVNLLKTLRNNGVKL